MQNKHRDRKSQRRLILLSAVALVPIGFAYLLYYFMAGSEPWASSSKGQLLDPIRSANSLVLKNQQGQIQQLAQTGVWWLLVVSDESCNADCKDALHLTRSAHVLLNKDMSRVRRAWLSLVSEGLEVGASDDDILERYPELRKFTSKPGSLKTGVYIVDPLENIVLYYHYSEAGKPLLEDLKKLLKVSRIG